MIGKVFNLFIVSLSFGCTGIIYAQTPHVCGAGPGPNEVQAGMHPGGAGVAPTPLCYWVNGATGNMDEPRMPIDEESYRLGKEIMKQNSLTTQPRGYWKKTWGAIAEDRKKGILGYSTGITSLRHAKKIAREDCRQKGGSCGSMMFAYLDECAVVVAGNNQKNIMESASDIDFAFNTALNKCKAGATDCRIYYSNCTKPKFIESK
ncbi:hypothetical protein F993_00972 [Acinetobacter proteolyticus]|jgi:hypothetical protein|uniref:DUF4189 domain-containing protein n=1 Tax=Acinetobacter proteolyticus TaxID=1776741 RepID=A0A653K316_9GAMM|nr:DUF4189 domain-containing protein [Acinetobacter proteolyticus]ENU24726.1 hypothetical protein F993_00972 [Acinetobacter proteolyticus]WEI18294.1 DUF4189 domain-containing protein [Acinetobacter proteolyticus]VXA54840.1 conserved exported hypothetical protein [Acinetobacter proteolyticus]